MLRRVLTVLCIGFVCFFAASCGQSFDLESITATPTSPNIEGIGSTQQLTVTASFTNQKTSDVTTRATYQVGASADPNAPLDALTLNNSGLLQAVVSPTQQIGSCTWHAQPTDNTLTTYNYSTQPYDVTVTFTQNGVTATTHAYVSVDSAAGCYDGQGFPAPSGFLGN